MKTNPLLRTVAACSPAAAVFILTLFTGLRMSRGQTLAEAADGAGIAWSQSGTGEPWGALATTAAKDGVDMLVCASVNGAPTVSRVLESVVTGPGVLRFWGRSDMSRLTTVEMVAGGQMRAREALMVKFLHQWEPYTLCLPHAGTYTMRWSSPLSGSTMGVSLDQFSFTPAAVPIAGAADLDTVWTTSGGEPWMGTAGTEAADGIDFVYGSAPAGAPPQELSTTITGPAWIEYKWRGGDPESHWDGRKDGSITFLRNGVAMPALQNHSYEYSWLRERFSLPPGQNTVTWRITPGQTRSTHLFLDSVSVEPVTDGVSLDEALDNDGSWTLLPEVATDFLGRTAPGLGSADADAAVSGQGSRSLYVSVNGPGILSGWMRMRRMELQDRFDGWRDGEYVSLLPPDYWNGVTFGNMGPWRRFNVQLQGGGSHTVRLQFNDGRALPLQAASPTSEYQLDAFTFTPDAPPEAVTLPNMTISATVADSWKASRWSGLPFFTPPASIVPANAPALEFTVTGPGDFTLEGVYYNYWWPTPAVDGVPLRRVVGSATVHVGPGTHRIGFTAGQVLNPVFTPGPGITAALDMPEMTVLLPALWVQDASVAHSGTASLRYTATSFYPDSDAPLVVLPQPGTLSWWGRDPAGAWTRKEMRTGTTVTLRSGLTTYSGQSLWLDDVSFTPLTATKEEVKTSSGLADITTSQGIAFIPGGFARTPGAADAQEWVELRTPGPGRVSFRIAGAPPDILARLRLDGLTPRVRTEDSVTRSRPVKIDLPGPGQHVVRLGVFSSIPYYPAGFEGMVEQLTFEPNVRDIGAAVGLGSVPWLTVGEATAEVVSDPAATGGAYAVFQVTGDEEQPGASWSAPGNMPDNASLRLRYRYPRGPFTAFTASGYAVPHAAGGWRTHTIEFPAGTGDGFLGRSTTIPSLAVEVHVDQVEYAPWSTLTLAAALDSTGITWKTNITITDPSSGTVYPPTGSWEALGNAMLFADGDGAVLRRVELQDFLGGRAALLQGTAAEPGTLHYWCRMDPRAGSSFTAWGPAGDIPRSAEFVRFSTHVHTSFFWNGSQSSYSGPNDIVYLDRVRFIPDSVQSSFTAWSAALLPGPPDAARDYDGDGLTDFAEYAFDGLPDDATSTGYAPALTLTTVSGGGNGGNTPALQVQWRQRTGAGLTYTPEVSATLAPASWGSPPAAPVLTMVDSAWQQATLTIPLTSGARAFARVKVSAP